MTEAGATDSGKTGRILDEFLVLSAKGGDRAAFEALARRWRTKLAAHAWRLTGSADAAAEASQSAWVEIARGLDGLKDEAAFPAWAYRIVSRQCARRIAGLQRDRALARDLARDLAAQPEPAAHDPGPGAPDIDRLRAAIRALPAAQRAAVALFHFEEMSVAETAVALDIPAGTVKTRLMHARRALRAVLEGDDDA